MDSQNESLSHTKLSILAFEIERRFLVYFVGKLEKI